MMYVIRMLNSIYLSLYLDMPALPPLDPRCPLVNEMSPHIYTTYVSGMLGRARGGGGVDRVADAKEDNLQLKTLTSGGKYSVSTYIEASTVQIYVISNTFVTNDNFSELIRKISPTYKFF